MMKANGVHLAKGVAFNYTGADQMNRVVKRYNGIAAAQGYPAMSPEQEASFRMDLAAADGVNGNPPIDWQALMSFPDTSFVHDINGIHRHMDRSTGKLLNFFRLRSAKND